MAGMPQCPKCGGTVFLSMQVTVSGQSVPHVAIYCRECSAVITIVPQTAYK